MMVERNRPSNTNKPSNYKEMEDFINNLPANSWLGLLGAYAAGGITSVIQYLRNVYPIELELWRDKDIRHFFNSRVLSEFRTRTERSLDPRSSE